LIWSTGVLSMNLFDQLVNQALSNNAELK